MAVLPAAAQPIPHATLLRRHASPTGTPKPSPRLYRPGGPAPATLAALEARASIALNGPGELNGLPLRDTPAAIVLCTVNSHCDSCGRIYPHPSCVLVRYDKQGFSNSVHYNRTTLAPFLSLPRERRTIESHVPFCDECF